MGLPAGFLGVTESRVCSVLYCLTVFVQLLSLIRSSEPDLLALRSNSDIETCKEGANSLGAILGPSDVPRQRA